MGVSLDEQADNIFSPEREEVKDDYNETPFVFDQQNEEQQLPLPIEDFQFLVSILKKNQDKELKRLLREKEIRDSANQQLLQSASSQRDRDEIRQRQRELDSKAEETMQLIRQ